MDLLVGRGAAPSYNECCLSTSQIIKTGFPGFTYFVLTFLGMIVGKSTHYLQKDPNGMCLNDHLLA